MMTQTEEVLLQVLPLGHKTRAHERAPKRVRLEICGGTADGSGSDQAAICSTPRTFARRAPCTAVLALP